MQMPCHGTFLGSTLHWNQLQPTLPGHNNFLGLNVPLENPSRPVSTGSYCWNWLRKTQPKQVRSPLKDISQFPGRADLVPKEAFELWRRLVPVNRQLLCSPQQIQEPYLRWGSRPPSLCIVQESSCLVWTPDA